MPDPAVAKLDHAPRKARNVRLVRDQHDRQALVVQFLQHIDDLNGGTAVEIARRLIGQQDRGPVYQRARNRDALLLSAGELRWVMQLAIRQSYQFERVIRPLQTFLATDAGIKSRQLNILQRRRT